MGFIDVEKLLEEVSPENPCGEDFEYDPAFNALERESQGKPEQQIGTTVIPREPPHWSKVRDDALSLFSKTKDLRIAVHLTRALLNTNGLSGLKDGLELIGRLLQQHWDFVHPQLDSQEDNDPTLRLNTLAALCDRETILHELRETAIVDSHALGHFNLRDIDIALGKLSAPTDSDRPPPQMAEIDAAFLDCDLDQLEATSNAVNSSLEHIQTIEKLLADNVGLAQAADLGALTSVLTEAQQIISNHLTDRGVMDIKKSSSDTTQEPTHTSAQPVSGEINSREDVIRALDSACDYFARNEPSSPVPLLLHRAKRLIYKDFMSIMQDIAPNAISEVEAIRGPDTEE